MSDEKIDVDYAVCDGKDYGTKEELEAAGWKIDESQQHLCPLDNFG